MITIFLGDDTATSRNKYTTIKNDFTQKHVGIIELTKELLPQLHAGLLQSQSLFDERQIFFAENILSKKEQRNHVTIFDSPSTDNQLFIWEESIEDRIAKYYFKHADINVSKLPANIFSFLDSLYPSNLKSIVLNFRILCQTIDPHMTLFMLQKRVRELILVSGGRATGKKLAEWQLARLKNQVKKWDRIEMLLDFYDGLYRIEKYEKTGKNYYSIPQALDILFVYYLR